MKEFQINVLLADDHPGMIAGITHELASSPSLQIRGHAGNSTELVALLESQPCDVVVSDYAMPAGQHGDGLALFGLIARRFPQVRIVVLTMLDSPALLAALRKQGNLGGIVSKADTMSHLVSAVLATHLGGTYYSPTILQVLQEAEAMSESPGEAEALSPRESEVIRLYASGLRVDDIAARLHRSKKTISTQKSRAMQKLGLQRDTELMQYALEHGWVVSSRASVQGQGRDGALT
jgi:two-component system capsular synthesis response regulator RcsB